jgi:formylglycine-generating enzyme required for sulfatase activity
MRRLLCHTSCFAALTLALVASALSGRDDGEKAAVDRDSAADRTAQLIKQLGDDRFDQREAASRALAALGESALPVLRDVAQAHEDVEVRHRAARIVYAILRNVRKSKSLELECEVIEPGAFTMGSAGAESGRRPDEDHHRVRISRPFLLGKYEVTQDEYQRVMKSNPSWFAASGGGRDRVVSGETKRYPVERVTWFDALEFCNRLSALDGYAPYYTLGEVKREEESIVRATVVIKGGNGYHLPTEAQWEYACRAGSIARFHFGYNTTGLEGNIKSLPPSGYGSAPARPDLNRTTNVGSYAPNFWGLYDMHGNAGEWCFDWYHREYYADSPSDDPTGPRTGTHRVVRGGSWLVSNGSCRSASRLFHVPEEKTYHTGFRVARTP